MRGSTALKIAMWAVLALVFLSVALQMPAIVLRFIPPYLVPQAEAVDSTIGPGEELVVSYELRRRRICRLDFDRVVFEKNTGRIIYRDRTPAQTHDLGNGHRVLNEMPLPKTTRPGEYVLTTTVVNECPEGMHTTQAPQVHFRVIDQAEQEKKRSRPSQ